MGVAPRPVITEAVIAPRATRTTLAVAPPTTVREYVVGHPVTPTYLNGEIVVGSGLPATVTLAPIPGYQHEYAYVNGVPVLVEPQTRAVTYIYE
jgi:Protein of unknown function (DUF1236)